MVGIPQKRIVLRPCPSLSYIIGVYYGDGCAFISKEKHTKSHRYRFQMTAKDYDFVIAVKNALENIVNNRIYISIQKEKYFRVETQNKTLVRFLKKPFDYIRSFIEKHPADFLRGLFDSDGGIYHDRKGVYRVRLYNTNKEMLLYVKKLLLKTYGIISSDIWLNAPKGRELKFGNRIYFSSKDAWVLQIVRKTSVAMFMNRIGFSIKRKNDVWKQTYLKLDSETAHLGMGIRELPGKHFCFVGTVYARS